MSDLPEAMTAEFDTTASWTAQAVAQLGSDFALPAACRGSGSPAALTWLCEALQLGEGSTLLDAGAGVGGPGAFAARHHGAAPVLTDPMPEAVAASAALFGLPSLVCDARQLPFRAASFDAAWALGVVCTVEDKRQLLTELGRVLVPSGRLGLLVLLRTTDDLEDPPQGNSFPTGEELHELLDVTGFRLLEEVSASDFPDPPDDWQERTDRVADLIAERHGDHPEWQVAEKQSAAVGRLLAAGQLRTVVLHTRRV